MSDAVTRLNAALTGRYRIERQLGEGGMATVYLAQDLKHDRKVALKVLKPELAAVIGAERFLAEIKTTANLQHPHILPLHDSGAADGLLFYVMPYVEGETLRERIDRERQLAVGEAVGIATKVAGALQAAHERGVIHRDIKPANILLAKGEPLVSDFGIALAVTQGGAGRLTETGLSLGTPHYMSPEQATGDMNVGAATDIYALGCVLYEMLVGEPPYTGSTPQAVLGKIVTGEPDPVTKHRRTVPVNVDAAIRKALEKVPADRFSGAQDFAGALANPAFRYGETAAAGTGAAGGHWNRLTVGTTAAAALFALTTAWLALSPDPPAPVRHVERFAAPFLEGEEPSGTAWAGFDLSPDGRMLVYWNIPQEGLQSRLMVRRWDELAAAPLRDSDLGVSPAVSYDGLQVAFTAEGEIRVAALAGGPIRTLLRGSVPEWGPDGFVYASTDSGAVRVPSTGGAQSYIYRNGEGETNAYVWDVLPGGDRVLLAVFRTSAPPEIRAVDLRSGEVTAIVEGAFPRFLPTGHLVFDSDGTMMAARFDPDRLELLGTPIAIMEANAWSLADDGKLFYSTQNSGVNGLQLAWVTRSGQTSPVDQDRSFGDGPRGQRFSLSPDGSTVALREGTDDAYDIWLVGVDSRTRTRLTLDPAHDRMPLWEPDGRNVSFLSDRNGNFDVWRRAADLSGPPELVLDLEQDIENFEWSPDGQWLLLWTLDDDILAYRPGVDTEASPLLADPSAAERDPAISPDGRWIAFVSNRTGEHQVFVAPFPNVAEGGPWQVSQVTARYPRWAHGRNELFFQDDGQFPSMWHVEFEADAVFRAGPPEVLFTSPGWSGTPRYAEPFDVAPDDERFIAAVPAGRLAGEGSAPRFILVNNFFEELNRLVP